MNMKAFRIAVAPPDEDLAIAVLWEAGTSGVQVDSSRGDVSLLAFFPDDATTAEALAGAFERIPSARVAAADVPDVDWVARFRESFRAFRAGSFHVVPAWGRERPGKGRRLVVDPGQAFGTGTHESTRLSLAAIERIARARRPVHVLDVGTGSGILGIAALLLGARMAVGVEIDPDALPSAREHAALNGVVLHLVRGDGARCMRGGAFDLVVANITAPLILERAPELRAACRPGGHLVLAGLLREDVDAVRAAFEPGSTSIDVHTEGAWAALVVGAAA
jgi:ribosomal protein L11 methyltransferase